ncbi:glutathione S-transferase family protein [Motilimonas sp. KMU-193]|uniref:glutathione S-transferase family protein n=1 Tax=Motilimonas sp. KMU-193 TaxID=3388668 RepID=UPI00396B0515
MSHFTLHQHSFSGHSHRVALMLSLLGLPYNEVVVDLAKGEQKSASFLALNPLGQVPVLQDGDNVITDSNAILIYLATRYDPNRSWLPTAPLTQAKVQGFLSLTAGLLLDGPGALRLKTMFGAAIDESRAQQKTAQLLSYLERLLQQADWLVGDKVTIADVAMYSYIKLAPQGGVDLTPFGAVQSWLQRIEALPGYIAPACL